MSRELPSGFVEIPFVHVEVISGDIGGLRSFVLGRRWETSPSEGFLFLRQGSLGRDSAFHYAFDAEGFGILAGRALDLPEDDLDDDTLQDIFYVHEWSRTQLVPEGMDIGRVSLVMAPDGPAAIQVPAPGKDPDRAVRPPDVIVGAPRPVAANGGGGTRGVARNGGGEAAEPTTSEPELVRRTPHLDLSNEKPAPGDAFDVSVFVSSAPARAGEHVDNVIELPPGVDELDLRVWLVTTSHFAVTGARIRPLLVERNVDPSPPVVFQVIAREDVQDLSNAWISAEFSYRGRPAGRVRRDVELAPPGEISPEPEPDRAGPARVLVDPHAKTADLTVQIVGSDDRFRSKVTSPHLPDFEPEEVPWEPSRGTRDMVLEYMDLFTAEGMSDRERVATLKGAGDKLYLAAPSNFQTAFEQLVAAGKLRTVFVVSTEPYMPWELMVPKGSSNPLGVDYIVGRWPDPTQESPRQVRPLDDSYVIAPTYADTTRKLDKLEAERDFISGRFNGEVITPASFDALDQRFGERGTALVHFICHGEAGTGATQIIRLDDPDKRLTSVSLSRMEGARLALAKEPLVFLNACEVGRQAPALVGLGGFGPVFVELGARCVIAPLWSVKDTIAHEVAVEFYETVLAEPTTPFAEILRRIRGRAYGRGGGEDTWAAYCFYGDPFTAAAAA